MGIQEIIVTVIGIAVVLVIARKIIRLVNGQADACSCCSKAGGCQCCNNKATDKTSQQKKQG
ncbi:MAG: hypothetical protein IKP81_04910 [Paludibacteraceae bacterium]|nr:hypothetical protein [Paludibacteraceae bacterium]